MGKFIERIGRCEVSNNNELREKGGYIVEVNSPNEENKKAIRDNLKIKTAKRDNIYLSGITLGENEKISIKYLIKVDTDAKGYSEKNPIILMEENF